MDEFNLDFLKTPPKHCDNDDRVGNLFGFNEFDNRFGKRKRSKNIELAINIAKVDELVREIDNLKSKNVELQQQLKGFQASARQVQELYIKEKNGHSVAKQDLDKLQKEHSKIDENLTNMSLVNEQLKARLDEYDGRPISFEKLLVKYVKVMTKFQEDSANKYSQDKDLLERLREYCTVMKYKVPPTVSPKKSRSRGNKTQTREFFVQCDLFGDSTLKILDCSACKSKVKLQNQSTQCTRTKHDKATQYISTMVTRQTNTENVVQKHVQTMFPEIPDVDDILKVYAKWSNIRSVSPLIESPPRSCLPKESLFNTGTCTMLCNIRRKIDYLPSNNSSIIKQEFFTPSASPTANIDSTATSGSRANTLSNHVMNNIDSGTLLNLFNSTSNSSLKQLSFNAFNELWQIFGKMLLSLIQNSNAGIASSNQYSNINQQQFLDWLLELYTNSKEHNTTSETKHTQTLEQRDTNGTISPLIFNGASILSTNILKPQPQRAFPKENVDKRNESKEENLEASRPNSIDYNYGTVSSDIKLKDGNINNEQQQQLQITSLTSKIHARDLCESNLLKANQNCKPKSNCREKSKLKIINEIQELLPGMKLRKKKCRILKRLLKKRHCYRKKSYESTINKNPQIDNEHSSVVILANDYNVEDTTETAVDFLKTFAVADQNQNNHPIEEDFSETEQIFLKQVSNDKLIENATNNVANPLTFEESTSIISSNSLIQSSTTANEESKRSKRIENKYKLLFGDCDVEEVENFQNVINNNIDLKSNGRKYDTITSAKAVQEEKPNPSHSNRTFYEKSSCAKNIFNDNCNLTDPIKVKPANVINNPQESEIAFSVDNIEQNINEETSENSLNPRSFVTVRNVSQSPMPISEYPCDSSQEISILKDLEYAYPSDIIEFPDSELICIDNNLQNINPTLIIKNNPFVNIENSLANNFELPSDIYCVKDNNTFTAITNEIPKTEAKIKDACIIKDTNEASKISIVQDSTRQMPDKKKHRSLVEASFNSLPKLNEEECSNASLDSQPETMNSMTVYLSDFEKDFELSSDNESLSSENHISPITKVVPEVKESSQNDNSFYKDSVVSHTLSMCEVEPNTNLDSFGKELCKSNKSLNMLAARSKENNYINKFIPKNDDILYPSSTKKQHKQPIKHISSIKLTDSSELHNILELSCKAVIDNNQTSVENFETKEKHIDILSCQEKLVLPPEKQNPIGNFSTPNNHNDQLKTFPANCLSKTAEQNDGLKATKTCREKNILKCEDENYNNDDYIHDINIQSKTVDNSKQLDNLGSIILSQSQSGIHKTVNSSVCSIITVSDSTSNNEIFRDCNRNSDKKISSKLGALKLLRLNKTLGQEKPCNNYTPNVKESCTKNLLLEDTNRAEIINSKESADSKETISKDTIKKINDEENCVKPINSKAKNTEYHSFSTKNTSEHKRKEANELKKLECELEMPTERTTFMESVNSLPNNKVPIKYKELDEVDKFDLSDSFSMDDELMIDEEPSEGASKLLHTNPLELSVTEMVENCTGNLDSSNISTLFNSSLYNEILTESLNPIVNDLLQEDFMTPSVKSKRGRKRKSECLVEQRPYKRSQRLKEKQQVLEESLNLSKTQMEFSKCPINRKNGLNLAQTEDSNRKEVLAIENSSQLGFFRERDVQDDEGNENNLTINATNAPDPEEIANNTDATCENNITLQEEEIDKQISSEILDENKAAVNECSPDDGVSRQPVDNFIYTDSPQSPPPIETVKYNHIPDKCVDIPLELPIEFVPQDSNPKLFDALINSYKNHYQKQALKSVIHKELKRKENILQQCKEHIMLYCNNDMELELSCTSTSLINKLLSICPDYNLLQKAIIDVAQNADSPNVSLNDLPSITQEMPPRHLSKCLQRLFTFLRIIVTRNGSFCQDLIHKIENLLFNIKQIEKLSLQATLNLTQLYLMASKVQEYLQVLKHPARLFIAKCLYYYLQKSILMIHEVLLWYPTVLPHREDKTYDRSDALISVIQQILMNTKYDMEKGDLRGKLLISKLRYEYHFEPFKPTQDEVINVLIEKLKNSKFYNISLAFGLLCKRIGVKRTQNIILSQHLMPLANEYYTLALKTNEYDARIEVLLEIISIIVKPLPIETEIEKYFCEFARFFNGFERQNIQEAALCSILRLQRFNIEYCYSLLSHFQPTYNLNTHTQAMLKSFLYRRPLAFWKNLKSKTHTNCN